MSEIKLHSAETVAEVKGDDWIKAIVRIRVEAGWLYISEVANPNGVSVSQIFVPDSKS